MVEVFKTNVEQADAASELLQRLQLNFPDCRINFDLDDCDRILRLEGNGICTTTVAGVLQHHGFNCSVLEG